MAQAGGLLFPTQRSIQEKRVRPSWGLRQGCPASPVLWSVFTALLCQAFDQRLGHGWAAEHVAMYADDSHLSWQFHSYSGFERAITELRIILRLFANFDMRVNYTKTQAILLLSGSGKHTIRKLYVRHHDEGHRLLLLPGDPSRWLPLTTHTEYLGMIISYDGFEARSTRHRIHKANQRRWALASILHSRKIAIRYKLQIWRSCVQSTLVYGLRCFGLSPKLAAELNVNSMKHIRAIVSDQQHLTGRTHQEILEKYQLTPILQVIQKAHAREQQLSFHTDWMVSEAWHLHITDCLQQVQQQTPAPDTDSDQERWACPECDEMFCSAAALKIHAQRTHGIRTEKQQIFDRAAHSVGGLPTCKFCNKQFSRWQTLAHHINTMACPIFEPPTNPEAQSQVQPADIPQSTENHPDRAFVQLPTEVQPDAPPIASQLTAQRIARKGLRFFIPYKTLGRHLQQHCAICGQWAAATRVMKLHYRNSHPELFPKLAVNITSLIERCATPSIRCHYCDLVHQDWRAHVRKCTSVWQFAVLCIIQDPGNAVRGTGPGDGGVLWDSQAPASQPRTGCHGRQHQEEAGNAPGPFQVGRLGASSMEPPRTVTEPQAEILQCFPWQG